MSLSKVWTIFFNSIQWEKERVLEQFKGAWYWYARGQGQKLFINKGKSNSVCVWNHWICNVIYIFHRTDIQIAWYLQLENTAFIPNILTLVDFLKRLHSLTVLFLFNLSKVYTWGSGLLSHLCFRFFSIQSPCCTAEVYCHKKQPRSRAKEQPASSQRWQLPLTIFLTGRGEPSNPQVVKPFGCKWYRLSIKLHKPIADSQLNERSVWQI